MPGLSRVEVRDDYTVYRTFSFRQRADRCTIPELAAYILTNLLPSLRYVIRLRSMLANAGELEEMKRQSLYVATQFDLRMIVDQYEALFERVRLRSSREDRPAK